MEGAEIILSALGLGFALGAALITWAWKMQGQINGLKIQVAVNTTKDGETWTKITSLETKIDKLVDDVGQIKEDIAVMKSSRK